MSNPVIRQYFESVLKTWADSQNPKIPISFENVPFVKPTNGNFLETFLIPNITIDVNTKGNHQREVGLFQINCWAKAGVGMGQVEILVQTIKNLFPIVPKTSVVSVEKTPSIGKSMSDTSGWVIIPIVIHYRYESYNS